MAPDPRMFPEDAPLPWEINIVPIPDGWQPSRPRSPVWLKDLKKDNVPEVDLTPEQRRTLRQARLQRLEAVEQERGQYLHGLQRTDVSREDAISEQVLPVDNNMTSRPVDESTSVSRATNRDIVVVQEVNKRIITLPVSLPQKRKYDDEGYALVDTNYGNKRVLEHVRGDVVAILDRGKLADSARVWVYCQFAGEGPNEGDAVLRTIVSRKKRKYLSMITAFERQNKM